MRKSLFLGLSALLLTSVLPARAVRANTDLMTVTQPDGTKLNIRLVGDERAHFTLTEDGALLAEENGIYFFGRLDEEGRVVSTGVRAANPALRTSIQKEYAVASAGQDLVSAAEKRMKLSPRFYDKPLLRKYSAPRAQVEEGALPQYGLGRVSSSFPNVGEVKALVLLVEYQDVKFSIDKPHEYFHNLLNKDGYDGYSATGCAAEYFRYNSNNQFIPTFDVIGPVTLSENQSYYGANSGYDIDANAGMMVVEGLKALDDSVDFSQYDMDGDGVLDNVFVFYAGRGEATGGGANTVWPHSSDLRDYHWDFTIDNVVVGSYGCTNEITAAGTPDGVGTFIHEFSHVIGLPDLYDTTGMLRCTPDAWSVLDYGPYNNNGHTPPNYSAYELNAMGWIEPVLIDRAEDVVLENLADSRVCRLVQTERENEFFLIENRQKKGWDAYLPGHGMLIWHVDWNERVFENNVVNIQSTHQYVHLKKANNIHSSSRGNTEILGGWSWPGNSGATEFTATTEPAFQSWSGRPINLPFTDIREENGIISFLVDGGVGKFGFPVALEPTEEEIGKDWFVAKWEPIEIAPDYLLTVTAVDKGGDPFEVVADMGNGFNFELPDGWSVSDEAIITTNGFYGDARPALKLEEDNAWMLSQLFNADIEEISFWYKGQATFESVLEVIGLTADGSEVKLSSIVPVSNKANTEVIQDIPAGVRQVKLVWKKTEGAIAIDDVKIIRYGVPEQILAGYDRRSTSGRTSVKIEGLDDSKYYRFYVEATDGDEISHPSNAVLVKLNSSLGTVEIADDSVIAVNGRTITSSEPVAIYDLSGSVLVNGVSSYEFAAPGLYLVRSSKTTRKIIVR